MVAAVSVHQASADLINARQVVATTLGKVESKKLNKHAGMITRSGSRTFPDFTSVNGTVQQFELEDSYP